MLPRSTHSSVLAVSILLATSPLGAQTIHGRLLDLETDQPIDLGLVILLTESGDSVTSTLSDPSGRFSMTSPEPGSFVLLGSAFGYRETPAGVFELGEGGEMTVQFRLRPEPLPLDGLLVGVEAPVFDHHLVQNGFVRRLQRGLGHFITPYDIENSMARDTESLFQAIPGVVVRNDGVGGGHVLMRSPTGGHCDPEVFIDGMKVLYQPMTGRRQDVVKTISTLLPLATVEAVEVYRRAAEIPVEYGVTQGAASADGAGYRGVCGVLVFWTKTGLAAGQAPARSATSIPDPGAPNGRPALPATEERGPAPTAGERIRMALDAGVASSLGLGRVLEGTFVTVRGDELVATEGASGRRVAVPGPGVEMLQVERERDFQHAVRRGVIAGSAFGVGSWLALRLLCGEACARRDQAALPAALIGVFGGVLVGSQGPGTHWVEAPLPEGGRR